MLVVTSCSFPETNGAYWCRYARRCSPHYSPGTEPCVSRRPPGPRLLASSKFKSCPSPLCPPTCPLPTRDQPTNPDHATAFPAAASTCRRGHRRAYVDMTEPPWVCVDLTVPRADQRPTSGVGDASRGRGQVRSSEEGQPKLVSENDFAVSASLHSFQSNVRTGVLPN